MKRIRLFLQVEGNRGIEAVEVLRQAKVSEMVAAALRNGLPEENRGEAAVFSERSDEPLALDARLVDLGISDGDRVHVHRCKQIEVTLRFNDLTKVHRFPPSATVDRVKREFVKLIGMSPVDATEHALQICGTSDRPEPDVQIGALVSRTCTLCFDLVPIKRVEG